MESVDSRDATGASVDLIDLTTPPAGDVTLAVTFDTSAAAIGERQRLFAERAAMTRWKKGDWANYFGEGRLVDGIHRTAHAWRAAGITVIPQEAVDGERRPAKIGPYSIRPSDYFDQPHRQSESEIEGWINAPGRRVSRYSIAPGLSLTGDNVAMIVGEPSGGIIMIDADIASGLALSIEVERVIEKRLGRTPVKRVGRAPKLGMFYRLVGDFSSGNPPKIRLANGDAIEFLTWHSLVTVGGLHHVTRAPFLWSTHLLDVDPSEIPAITLEDIEDLRADLLDHFDATTSDRITADAVDPADLSDLPTELGTPRQLDQLPPRWRELGDRKVGAGQRREFLLDLTLQLARTNPIGEELVNDIDTLRTWSRALAGLALEMFARHADRSSSNRGDVWHIDGQVLAKAVPMCKDALRKVSTGSFSRLDRRRDKSTGAVRPNTSKVPSEVFRRDPRARLGWLTARDYRPARPDQFDWPRDLLDLDLSVRVRPSREVILRARQERTLEHDRSEIADIVSGVTIKMVDEYIAALSDATQATKLRVLRSKPGAGKTSRSSKHIVKLFREIDPESKIAKVQLSENGCLLFVVRNYVNARELLEHMAAAGAVILQCHDQEPGPRPDGEVRVGLMVGKAMAGCPMLSALNALNKSGLPSMLACYQEFDTDFMPGAGHSGGMGTVTEECVIRAGGQCGYYNQEKIFSSCQIIVCVASYLSVSPPAWLTKRARGVVIDEDPTMNLLTDKRLKIADLLHRRDAQLTPTMTKLGFGPDSLGEIENLRDILVGMALRAMQSGRDVAADLLAYREVIAHREVTGDVLLATAKACVAPIQATSTNDITLRPLRASDDAVVHAARLVEYAEKSKAAPGLTAERVFWSVISSRMDSLRADEPLRLEWQRTTDLMRWVANDPAAEEATRKIAAAQHASRIKKGFVGTAKGATDAQLQLLKPDESGRHTEIRISNRKRVNFEGVPKLLLDASAQSSVVKKLFGCDIVEDSAPVKLNLRVVADVDRSYANSQFIEHIDDAGPAMEAKELLVARVRLALTKTAFTYAPDRVLFVATAAVANRILRGWQMPGNVDVMYYGNLRGQDGARNHAALVSVGRSELPADTVDALADALGYDDDVQPARIDPNGDGKGRRIWDEREVRLRNGDTLTYRIQMAPSERGKQIETGWREQELVQTAGRLRCVYRQGAAPLWLSFTSCMPEDFEIDALVRLEDCAAGAEIADEARKAGQILSDLPALPIPSKIVALQTGRWRTADLEAHIGRIRRESATIRTSEVFALALESSEADWRAIAWDGVSPEHDALFQFIYDARMMKVLAYRLEELDLQAEAALLSVTGEYRSEEPLQIADDIGATFDMVA